MLITGPPGSGKTTIAREIAQRFPKSIHIQVDHLREMMVNGIKLPDNDQTEESNQQFQLARSTAIYMAQLYAEQNMFVIIDDLCVPEEFAAQYTMLFEDPTVERILLLPTAEALIERLRKRCGALDEILIECVPWLYGFLEPMPKDSWIVLDSRDWTVEQTVAKVLACIGVSPGADGRA